MQKIIKSTLFILIFSMALSLFSCTALERLFLGGEPYAFSNIVLTQVGVDEFRIEFTVDCGNDNVDIYLTEGFRRQPSAAPVEAEKSLNGKKARFSFVRKLNLGEDYYIWVVNGEKEAKTSLPVPSMFPCISMNDDGSALFEFRYTYGTAWASFCDPTGKAVYVSPSPIFNGAATLLQDNIDITVETYTIPKEQVSAELYYYAVSMAKDGEVMIVSSPVMLFDGIKNEVKGISARITNDLLFQIDITIPEASPIAHEVSDKLQLVIKTNTADEIHVVDCLYTDSVASMSFNLKDLIFEGLWYDVLIAWNGAIVMDVPKYVGGKPIETTSSVKKDGIIYSTAGWSPDGTPENEMLKLFFEEDTTRYADEICKSYLVSFIASPEPMLQVVVTLKNGVENAPVLAITGGDKTMLASATGTLNDDGTYTFLLPVTEAISEADKWYDLRFFVENTAYEMLKDSCISYTDFAKKYDVGTRRYEFREYNGVLKLMYTELAQ